MAEAGKSKTARTLLARARQGRVSPATAARSRVVAKRARAIGVNPRDALIAAGLTTRGISRRLRLGLGRLRRSAATPQGTVDLRDLQRRQQQAAKTRARTPGERTQAYLQFIRAARRSGP